MIARALLLAALVAPAPAAPTPPAPSHGRYRLPFADGTGVSVFDDARSHRPLGRVDLVGEGEGKPYRVVAAAAGRVVAIQDGWSEQQSGRAAALCHNNFVWIAHRNGEWTNYSHLAHGTATGAAGLKVGMQVKAGQFLGYEGAVGCAMLDHVHFEVATPAGAGIDAGGFLLDNDGGKRNRDPRFCGVAGGSVRKQAHYIARAC